MRLQRERAVESQQGAVGVAELVPHQREVGVGLDGAFQHRQRVREPRELDQGRTLERQGKRPAAELHLGAFGESQGVLGPARGAQQFEVLRPAGLQVRMSG